MPDGTLTSGLVKSADSTASSFTSLAPGTAPPALQLISPKSGTSFLVLYPLGSGADGATYDLRVLAVERALYAGATEYVLRPLAQFAVTLCATTGAAGRVVSDTERFADTITQTFGASSA